MLCYLMGAIGERPFKISSRQSEHRAPTTALERIIILLLALPVMYGADGRLYFCCWQCMKTVRLHTLGTPTLMSFA
jgi:hypothetical protein